MRDRGTVNPETQRILSERASKLAALAKHASWDELLAEFERRKERDVKAITTDLVAGKPLTDAQSEIDYARGFASALKWVARIPKSAEDTLERALRKADEEKEVTE